MPNLRRMKIRGRRARAPRMRQPDAARLEYFRALKAILYQARGLVKKRLLQLLPELLERAAVARGDAARLDANPGRRINRKLAQISDAFYRRFPQEKLERLAAQIANATAETQKRELFRQVKALVGVDLTTIADRKLRERIRQFTAENVALISSVPQEYFHDVEKTMLRGMREGSRAREIAKDLEERYGVAESRAKLIARDQVGKFFGELNMVRQQDLGLSRYIWRTVNDSRVRPEHEALDGQVFSWDEPPEDGHPGEAINCRCYAEPVLDEPDLT